jgi:hypothetical protein
MTTKINSVMRERERGREIEWKKERKFCQFCFLSSFEFPSHCFFGVVALVVVAVAVNYLFSGFHAA